MLVGIPVDLYFRVVNLVLFLTEGKFVMDKIRGVVNNGLQWTMAQLDFMGDPAGGETVTPDLKSRIQHYLNVYLGLEADSELEATIHRHGPKPIEQIARWGVQLDQSLVQDVTPEDDKINEAISLKARAEVTRDANLVEADATARATERVAEGQKRAEILKAEGDKQATVLRAEGDKTAKILLGEGEQSLLMQQIAAFDADQKVTPAAVQAFLRKYQFQIYGENIQQSGRAVIMQMPGGDSGATLAAAIVGLRELLGSHPELSDPAKLADHLTKKAS